MRKKLYDGYTGKGIKQLGSGFFGIGILIFIIMQGKLFLDGFGTFHSELANVDTILVLTGMVLITVGRTIEIVEKRLSNLEKNQHQTNSTEQK